jgi:hypothetical protein
MDGFMRHLGAHVVVGWILIGRGERHLIADHLLDEAREGRSVLTADHSRHDIAFASDCADDANLAVAKLIGKRIGSHLGAYLGAFLVPMPVAVFFHQAAEYLDCSTPRCSCGS